MIPKKSFIDQNLKGKRIEQTPKTSSSIEVDGDSRFCGHRFVLATRLYGDKRCVYCGRWFHWKDTDFFKWHKEKNLDHTNVDGNPEPLHCASEHCSYYHRLVLEGQARKAIEAEADVERRTLALFKQLAKQKVIA